MFALRRLILAFLCGCIGLALATPLRAQVKPNADWRTIRTPRFHVHYTPEVEDVARRAAAQAEAAYEQLSRFLRPPRGPIDIVISDDIDVANGYASAFPSNRIGIYANPPIFESSLRFTDDHTALVVTHELAHVFHLDRSGGIWAVLQKVFGRHPLMFPNTYNPRWLTEGLAVYYESRLTEGGRLHGTEHAMIARAAAIEHAMPGVDRMSLANPHFPYSYSAYAYGSLLMDYLGDTHGDAAMGRFVEQSSKRLLPWTLNGPAKRAFGRSFTAAYRAWADSLVRDAAMSPNAPALAGWRDLTVEGAYALAPRWMDDSTIVYNGTPGDQTFGAYALRLRGDGAERTRLARRHSASANARLADGSLLYSQLEYTSLYTIRSDLYMDHAKGGVVRLTWDQRLLLPDARRDSLIVAVQTIPAGSRLALVAGLGRSVTPITNGGPDEQWSDPRWSPDGRWIAASRWTRGAVGEIVVVDTTGRIVQTIVRERAVASSPSWSPDSRFVYFASDRSGITNVYRSSFNPEAPEPGPMTRVSDARTGLFDPQISPNGTQLAAVMFRADGYHVGVAPIDALASRSGTDPDRASLRVRDAPPVTRSDAPAKKYSPWRQLVPRYWEPIGEAGLDSNSWRYGLITSGIDIVERHAYTAAIMVPSDASGLTGSLLYRNQSFGLPIDFLYSQEWENRGYIIDQNQQGAIIGTLRRRIRDASVILNLLRPRLRTYSYLNLGLGYEARDYATGPAAALGRIDSLYSKTYYYPRVTASVGWSNAQYPLLAVSQEDGVALAATSRLRWRSSPRSLPDSSLSPTDPSDPARTVTLSAVGTASAYKSLDLPGFAHHVIAVRGAGGVQDNRGTGYFEVGGTSGGVVDVLPGYVLGEGRRTFSVRGFEAATLSGIYAAQGSAEYRAPLRLPGRGVGTLPLFLDRMSLTLFGDAGAAWCPGTFAARPAPATSLCTTQDVAAGVLTEPEMIASAGGELAMTAAVMTWDAPFRWRLGFAVPLVAPSSYTLPKPRFFFAVGVSF